MSGQTLPLFGCCLGTRRFIVNIFRVTGYTLKNCSVCLSLKISFVLANRTEPGGMPHYAAFHLDFHCFPKYPFRKGLISYFGRVRHFVAKRRCLTSNIDFGQNNFFACCFNCKISFWNSLMQKSK